MSVRVIFIHPEKGMQDVTVTNAPSVEDLVNILKGLKCEVLFAEGIG